MRIFKPGQIVDGFCGQDTFMPGLVIRDHPEIHMLLVKLLSADEYWGSIVTWATTTTMRSTAKILNKNDIIVHGSHL